MNWCLIIPLLTGVISAILGYFLGKATGGDKDALEACKSKTTSLEKELTKVRAELKIAQESIKAASVEAPAAIIPFDADMAKAVFGKKIKQDDLKIVEGIGPQIEKLFKEHGITTWKQLSETSVARCQEILDDGGKRFEIHDPETWHEQARLAYEGKWKKLYEWQEKLDGGRL